MTTKALVIARWIQGVWLQCSCRCHRAVVVPVATIEVFYKQSGRLEDGDLVRSIFCFESDIQFEYMSTLLFHIAEECRFQEELEVGGCLRTSKRSSGLP
ncbi:hypothetical protein J3R30DRAFT_3419172 [Lentinula aciculospora]|uniref:Secreted protein n=1 Tax=Lentinula aciculospora TaxID=153920 RepID=A0A9W9ATD3_9AGAR|nr:hypothetical protein J3R30DRAFT_3419172 [Lentinula aciculospora]